MTMLQEQAMGYHYGRKIGYNRSLYVESMGKI